MAEPVPDGAGEAAATVVPGYAEVVAVDHVPAGANAFAGRHDYRFTLLPDPGPEFVGASVDVYVDEMPIAFGGDEQPQPWIAPFSGLARDDARSPWPA